MAVDPTQINNSLNSQLPDNNTGRITPAVLRTALTTGTGLGLLGLTGWIVATFAGLTSPNTFTGAQTFTGPVAVNGALTAPSIGTPQTIINVTDTQWAGGAKCDYNFATGTGTDDTAAFAAAISAAETGSAQGAGLQLIFPARACLSGPQTITGQIDIEGASAFASVLVLKSGSNAAMLTYLTTGYNFPGDGHPEGLAYARNFRITSQDGYTANATYPNARGINIPSGSAWSLWAYFDDITIYNMPSDGVQGIGGANTGLGYFKRLYVQKVGGIGWSTNSTNDWVCDGCNISLSQGDGNILSAGDSSIYFHNLNSYSSTGHGVHIFGRSTVTFDGHTELNLNSKGGLYIEAPSSDTLIVVNDLNTGSNSQGLAANWPDVYVYGGSGTIRIARGSFPAAFSINGNNSSLGNVFFGNSTTAVVSCEDCVFAGGAWNISPQTNSTSNFFATGASSQVPWLVANLPSSPPDGIAAQHYVIDAISCSSHLGALTSGGSTFCPVIFTGTTHVASAAVYTAGSGGTNGAGVALTVTAPSCSVAPVLSGTISGGVLTAITSVTTAGVCISLPSLPSIVTGGGLTGASVSLVGAYTGSWVQD